jgi:hypothetical protein
MSAQYWQISSLPLYLDGSGDSMWPARATVDDIVLKDIPAGSMDASRIFVRLSDLLADIDRGDFAEP